MLNKAEWATPQPFVQSQLVMAFDDRRLMNAGSVGWQIDGDPQARWTLLERRPGRWQGGSRRVAHDTEVEARWVLTPEPDAQVDVDAHPKAEAYRTGHGQRSWKRTAPDDKGNCRLPPDWQVAP
jgi:hypothetical protein